MAEVRIEEKRGVPWWAWLLGVLIIGAIIWWVAAANTGDRYEDAVATPGVNPVVVDRAVPDTPGATAATAELPLAAIQANPDAYFGKPVSGMATVTEVVGERGFWVEQDGNRMFILTDPAKGEADPVTAGRSVSFTGTVIDPDRMQEQAPAILQVDEATLKMMQGLPAFIHATNIEMQNS